MRGLILKDMYAVRQLFKSLAFIFLAYAVLSVIMGTNGLIVLTMVFMGSSIFFQIFNGDKVSAWDSYAFAMPVSRRLAVISRYAFGTLIVIVSTLMGLIISSIVYFTNGAQAIDELALLLICGIAVLCLMMAILFPMLYKFGIDKGRVIFVGVFMSLFIIIYGITKLKIPVTEANLSSSEIILSASLMMLLTILFIPISAYLSIKIEESKMRID